MGRMSFTQELKALGRAGERIDAGGCWREVIYLHRELGRHENALGRAAWTIRYGQRGEWRAVLREAAAETLREARRAASVYDTVRLKEAAGCYLRLAGSPDREVAELMLEPADQSTRSNGDRQQRRFEHVAPEVRWIGERPAGNGRRRRGRGRRARRHQVAAAA